MLSSIFLCAYIIFLNLLILRGILERVAKKHLILGVPYKQDIRVRRTTCYTCGKIQPPWGHLNRFDIKKLRRLFPKSTINKISFLGENYERTNFISAFLMDLAGNPDGTYNHEEQCIHCGAKLKKCPKRNVLQKILIRTAFYLRIL